MPLRAHRRAAASAGCVGLVLLALGPSVHAQTLTGNGTSEIDYQLYVSPGINEAFVTVYDPTQLNGTAGATSGGTPVDMALSFRDSVSALQPATATCGAGCYQEAMNGSGTFSVVTQVGNTTLVSGALTGGEIFATPGSSQAVIQFTLTTSSGTEYVVFSGATAPVTVCSPGTLFCTPAPLGSPPAAGALFSGFSLSGAWTETLSTTPYGGTATLPPRQVYLNGAKAWAAPPSAGVHPQTRGRWRMAHRQLHRRWATTYSLRIAPERTRGAPTSVNYDVSSLTVNSLTIDGHSATDHGVYLVQAANQLASVNETIGTTGVAGHVQTGGTNTVSGTLAINTYGTYSLQGGTLNAGTIQLNSGGSLLLATAGSLNFAALNIAGGSVNSAGNERLDSYGQSNATYIVTQSSGSNTVVAGGSLYMGNGTATGTYLMQGGSLVTAASMGIGVISSADFQQSGGTVALGNGLALGVQSGSAGTYELSGPSSVGLSAPTETIGLSGSGTFTQTGGTNNVTSVVIAANTGASGTYDLKGGSLYTTSVSVNSGGTFIVENSGTTFSNAAGNVVNVSGGTLYGQTGAQFVNSGALSNTSGGTIFNLASGQLSNTATGVITNDGSGTTLNNSSTLSNGSDGIRIGGAVVLAFTGGTINNQNHATIFNYLPGSTFFNSNGGVLNNTTAATFSNQGGATLVNSGGATINNNTGAIFVNDGAGTSIVTQSGASFNNGQAFGFGCSGSSTCGSSGIFRNQNGATFAVLSGGSLNNVGVGSSFTNQSGDDADE